jgi:unsaturated chondroitin disaccharide hydrolase
VAARRAPLEANVELALRSIDRTMARPGTAFPHVTEAGRWQVLDAGAGPRWENGSWRHGNWTAGFWVGCLWLAALCTGDDRYAAGAELWANRLAGRERDDTTHDLGFLFYPSHVLGSQAGGNGLLSARALAAARSLLSRYVEARGYIQAWGPRGHPEWVGVSTIDTMMNLPLLWWAARTTGDVLFAAAAAAHARATAEHFFRPDGSTYHMVTYGREAGGVDRKGTFQGYGDESCWARGQSWAISGFAIAYRETGDPRFLAAADAAARYFLARLPSDGIPYWDFDDPAIPRAPRDSSALAIAVQGLWELSEIHPSPARAMQCRGDAERLLEALATRCQNQEPDRVDGVMLHGCYSRPHGEGVDAALIWGDFFYLYGLISALRGRRPELSRRGSDDATPERHVTGETGGTDDED